MLTMFAEVRRDGQWHKVGGEFVSTFKELEGQLTDRVYDGHNKELMKFLKDQCNGGIPRGMSDSIRTHKFFQDTAIWYTSLAQLLSFEWDKKFCKIGYISDWQYKRLKENGIEPVNIVTYPARGDLMIANSLLADLVENYPVLKTNKRFLVEYEYDKCTMRDIEKFFCTVSIPKLIELIPQGGTAADVRIVFSDKV